MTSNDDMLNPPEDLFKPARAPRVIGIGILATIVVLFGLWMAGQLDSWVDFVLPDRAEVHGTVILNGKPMTRGIVQSYPSLPGFMCALSPIEPDGTFRLLTNGDAGAYCGEHKVVVKYMTTTMPPKSLIPLSYTEPETTPFRLLVKRNKVNKIELVLEAPDLLEAEKPKEEPAAAEPEAGPQSEDSEGQNSTKN